jgi:hypothetical protein
MNEMIRVVDIFFSQYFGYDIAGLAPDEPRVVASERRERHELGYGPIFAVWLLITKNRCAISLQERLLYPVTQTTAKGILFDDCIDQHWQRSLTEVASDVLKKDVSTASGPIFHCTPELFRPQRLHPCRRVEVHDVPSLQEVGLYSSSLEHSIGEDTCFAAFHSGIPVALSGTHVVPHMADAVGDLNVPGTLEAYRRRGFGKTVVSHTTEAILAQEKVPIYATSDWNIASARTDQAVGYVRYGWQFRVQVQRT